MEEREKVGCADGFEASFGPQTILMVFKKVEKFIFPSTLIYSLTVNLLLTN